MARSLLVILLAVLGSSGVFLTETKAGSRVDVGSKAPPFALLGGDHSNMGGGLPSLIAFLDFSEVGPARSVAPGPSQEEAGAIRTLASWQGAGGLRAVIIDAAPTVIGHATGLADLSERARTWGIEAVPIVQDHPQAGLARRYGVTHTPCVFLVDAAGVVRARWDREVDAAEIAGTLASLGVAPRRRPGAAVR